MDAEVLSRLAIRSKRHWDYPDAMMRVFERELTVSPEDLERRSAYVLERDGRALGFYTLLARGGKDVELEHLFIEPDVIRTGLGARLLSHARDTARWLGFQQMTVLSDPNAQGFYTELGARQVGTHLAAGLPGRELPVLLLDLELDAALSWGALRKDAQVLERAFVLRCRDAPVPGVLWLPIGEAKAPRPLVLMGHGFTVHKRSRFMLPWAKRLARQHGFAVAALDAPGHGDRMPDGGADPVAVDRAWRAHWRAHAATEIAREWSAAIDALQALPQIGPARVGYWGLSLGTQYGLGVVAQEARVRAAVLGLAVLPGPRVAAYADRVSCPVFFIAQRDDEMWSPERTRALFDRIASEQKSYHLSPGAHEGVPPRVMRASTDFLVEHLTDGV